MKICIEYDSCWRNSFLDGTNNEPLPKGGRDFISSMSNLNKDKENFKVSDVTLDTVMGVLNRLIGDQRKLYQVRSKAFEKEYFFEDLENKINFIDSPVLTKEMTYIRNMKGSTDQNSFTGMIKATNAMFTSDYSTQFWSVLGYDFSELCDFILSEKTSKSSLELNPLAVIDRLELLNKCKAVLNEDQVNLVLEKLKIHFPEINYLNVKGMIAPISFYCSALYLQLERLSEKFDMTSAKTKVGGISGISKKGFTKKDFMDRFTTGSKKIIWGNPYMRKEKIKGQGEVTSLMTKASGQLEITIDVDKGKGAEIKTMIENAGVSSFYLGKKGLAYVSDIRV